jgi:hypothetical protein
MSLKLLIQQIHPHVRVERDSGMCEKEPHELKEKCDSISGDSGGRRRRE